MAKRRPPTWHAPFLTALAQGHSVRGAARAAGIDHTTAYLARRAHPDFAGRWDAALAEGRARLDRSRAGLEPPPPLARDEIVRASRHGRPCVMRAAPGRWCAETEAVFLAALEESANVRAAAAAAGLSTVALYNRRQREPAFAAAWEAALHNGYLDVEGLLIENCKAVLSNAPKPRRRGRLTEDVSVADAINILRLHRSTVKGGAPQRYDWRAQEPDIEEVRAEILRKVAAMERAAKPG